MTYPSLWSLHLKWALNIKHSFVSVQHWALYMMTNVHLIVACNSFAIGELLCSTQYYVCVIVTYTSTTNTMHCCISTSPVFTRTCHCVTWYIHCLPYNILLYVPRSAKWSPSLRLLSNKTVYTSLPSHMCAFCLSILILLDLITLIITWLWAHHKASHCVVFSSFSVFSYRPKYLPHNFILEYFSLRYFLNVRDQDL